MKWFWFFVSFFIPVSASPSLWSEASAEPWTWQTLGTTSFSRPQHPCRMAWKLPFLAKNNPKTIPSTNVPSSSETDVPLARGWAEGTHPWLGALVTPFCHPMGLGRGDGAAGGGEGCAGDAVVSRLPFIAFPVARITTSAWHRCWETAD